MMMKKLSAVALAVAMSFSLSACTLGSTSWILKYGDDNQEVPTGIYVQNMYTAYSAAGQYATGGDTLLESSIEDKTADQWIRDTAMNLTKQYLAVTLKFDELGLTLTEAENTNIQSMVDSVWKSYGESYTLMGVNRDSYQKMLEYTAKTGDLFQHFYGEGGELAPTEEEYKHLITRLNRIEGQIRGIRSMVEKDVYCTDILVQAAAARSALNGFTRELIDQHLSTCVAEDLKNGGEEKLQEFLWILNKLV